MWRKLYNFENYEITENGKIRSWHLIGGGFVPFRKPSTPRMIKAQIHPKTGYVYVSLKHKKKRVMKYVHRLVLESFVGPNRPGEETAHLNGKKTDNRLENLQWVSRKENHSHKILHCTTVRGSKHVLAKLTENKVIEIRAKFLANISKTSLSREYGVSFATIDKIINKKSWAWF